MAARREKVTLVLDDSFSARVRLMADAVATLGPTIGRLSLNTHRLDRVDHGVAADPHRWPGDDS